MADSDGDYGDLDDTAFLEAATEYDQTNEPAFQPSPRPSKRRKVDQRDGRAVSILPRQQIRTGNHEIADSDSEDAAFDSLPHATSPRLASVRQPHIATLDDSDGQTPARKTRPRPAGKENSRPEKDDEPTWKAYGDKRKKNRIHTPTATVRLTDVACTQPPLEKSPPWKPRGAIWRKAGTLSTSAMPDVMNTMMLPGRQSISSRPVSHPPDQLIASLESLAAEESDGFLPPGDLNEDYDPAFELADLPSDAFASSSDSPQKEDNEVSILSERRIRVVAPQTGLRQTTLFGRDTVAGGIPASQANKRYNFVASQVAEPPTHHKLDSEAIKTWVYPTNLGETRDYQFNIVARGLFHNLLVALPTGLGKTFIAATIMLNWYRWTTEGQIVFMAPTKPLVSQQVEACFNIAGIPRSQTSMLVGGVSPGLRAQEFATKRVFFMTPQTLLNDLKSGIADAKKIVLLVVDEAHRATGSYAYCEVVSFMRRFNQSYRILALTATPGHDVESVQKVIDGLDISRIEIRTENSFDLGRYIHFRKVEKHTFTNSPEMEMCMDLYKAALQPCVSKLAGLNAFWSKDPLALTPFGCTTAARKYAMDAGRNANQGVKFMVQNIFATLGSISHGMELLKYHGIGPFYTKMKDFRDEQAKGKSKYKKEICDSKDFQKLMVRLKSWVTSEDFIGHPKLEFLQGIILEHFANAAEGHNPDGAPPSHTRIMIFAHFRDSAEEIVRVLKRHEPMIRPRVFVGQSHAKNSEGMDQKQQINVVEKFKQGIFNTLVATSIGEEGLDIGEVDLIVCYDSKASPIRMLQRMGRTGRKREGKIVLLQMEGKEEQDAIKAKDSYEKMQELIAKGTQFMFHDDISRRILPKDVQPVVDRRVVEIPVENSQGDFLPKPKKNGKVPKRPPKKFHMPDGVITGFVSANRMDEEIAPKTGGRKKTITVYPSEEPYMIPPLEQVLLDAEETRNLENNYQTVDDDDDDTPMIGPLNLGHHPARQRVLSQLKNIRSHGRVTQSFVRTLERMHAMNEARLNEFKSCAHLSIIESEPMHDVVVSEDSGAIPSLPGEDSVWASDDPASQPMPKPKTKPASKLKSKISPKAAELVVVDDMSASDVPLSQPLPTAKAKPGPKAKARNNAKSPAPRGRPRKSAPAPAPVSASTKSTRQLTDRHDTPPRTPTYRISDFVDEAAPSSPPPTDPRLRLPSQAIDLGSDNTIGTDEIQDTQAYLLDSDLRDFIADDDDDVDGDVEVPESSLPDVIFGAKGFGRGTQSIMREGRGVGKKPVQKIFTSDVSDGGSGVVSSSDGSDDDDDVVLLARKGAYKRAAVVDSDSDAENEEADGDEDPVVRPRKRARRIVDDDDDDDE